MTAEPSSPPCVLVVDDEQAICQLLAQYLSGRGFVVRTAADGAAMWSELRAGPVSVILLDVNMPGDNGFALLAALRSGGYEQPVVMLTSRHELTDRVAGVRGGADDYVVKPFEPREVLARLRAVLRRSPPSEETKRSAASEPVRVGRCWYDSERHVLTDAVDGGAVPLTKGESDVLEALLRHPTVTVERGRLAEITGNNPGGRGVDAHIFRLRRKVEPDPARPTVIVTRAGTGYAFEPER